MPMRSIPFKVVCLLGMNDGVYPRTLPPLGFDLMSQKPQRGDRSRRDDDRYLFLEALMSAEQTLYISYIGRSIQDNSERFPSVLGAGAGGLYRPESLSRPVTKSLTATPAKRGLKPTSPICIRACRSTLPISRKTRTRATLVNGWRPPASRERRIAILYSRSPRRRLTACRSISFCASGSTRYARSFSSVLRVNFRAEEDDIPDDEPFTLEGLSRYQLNQQLLNTLIEEQDVSAMFRRFRAAGELPYGAFGELVWETQRLEMQALAERVMAERQQAQSMEIDLQCGGVNLTGWLQQVQPDGLLRWRPSLLSVSQGMQLWLEHLVYCASGGTGERPAVCAERGRVALSGAGARRGAGVP
ncbi:Exodeoxyribonuclease V gamma chain [Serratia liquefaciens]|nr:Exodeoxyribonuclease V gamma chain [Serratia liquefaciens]